MAPMTAARLMARGLRVLSAHAGSMAAESSASSCLPAPRSLRPAGSRALAALSRPAAATAAAAAAGGNASVWAVSRAGVKTFQLDLPPALSMVLSSTRSMFGSAIRNEEQQQEVEEAAAASPLDVDIGGEGGYFDHDESHVGIEAREEIASLFDKWNAALATNDPEVVANLYGHDAVLLPTVSNEVRTTRAGIVDYFKNFLKLRPQGKVDQSQIRLLSPGVALHSGVYSFTLQPSEEETKMVQARFTFLYRKYAGEWRIAEHHSSAMPEAQPAGVPEMFDRWNSALQTGNPEIVADLYAPDGVLLPTVSNQVRTCRQGIVDYFHNFLKLKPYGKINNSVIREVAPGVAINSGVYTFKLTRPETGLTEDVRARYTFIYKKINEQWFIAEHHSSAMPEPAS